MMDYLEYLLLTIYSFSMILGTVVTTLTIILSVKKKTLLNNTLKIFSIAFLFYVLFEFCIYYLINNQTSNNILFAFIHISNLCYFIYILCWIKLLQLLCNNFRIFDTKLLTYITIIYATIAELIGAFTTEYDPIHYSYKIEEGIGKVILTGGNIIFSIFILIIACGYVIYAMKNLEKSKERNAVILFGTILFFYMIWIMSWDYHMTMGQTLNPNSDFIIDPLTFVYIIQSMGVVWFFFKKDPLEVTKDKIQESNVQNQENQFPDLEVIAQNFGLTNREFDVLSLVTQGLSNPEIGEKLYIAENTVKRHLNHIFTKIEVKNRYELLSVITRCIKGSNEH